MNHDLVDLATSTQAFMPHGMCYLWQPGVLGLHVISDGLIALAYFSIPFTLTYLVSKRSDHQFDWILMCFATFIIACGMTHAMDIWTIWNPVYWISGGIKAITALVSVATAILLIKVVPSTLRLPRASELKRVNEELLRVLGERYRAEAALQDANRTLELRVADRTAQLEAANSRLLQDNERFAIAADAAGLAFWSFELDSNKLQWDERMFHLYGVVPMDEDPSYEVWTDSLHPEDKKRCVQELTEALNGEHEFDTEFRILTPNGDLRYVRAAARVTRDGSGRALRMFGVNFDITERKRADEQFRLAIDAAPTGMLLMNRTGAIVLANAQIETLFGYTRAELLGRQIEMLVPERFRLHHPDFRQSFFAAPRSRAMGAGRDLYGLRKDGSEVPIEIGLNPLHTSQGMFVLSSIIDLTQRREIDRLRNDFVSTVSHELRTPLTSISGSLGLLQSGALGALSEKAAEMVQIAHKNSARLVRIINDILDVGKLESGLLALQLTNASLRFLLGQAIEANSSYAERYGVHFRLEESQIDDTVRVDADRLIQVITNLLSNAAKFSPQGADVHIRMWPGIASIRIDVEDAGPGIAESFQARIFEKFAQADASAARRFEGTGLGLSIARKLIEAMGGSIGFNTIVGKGTVFYIEVPRAPGAANPAGRHSIPRILYVEDVDTLVKGIRDTLAGKAELVYVRGSREAERRLREEQFDLVVVDQSLPDGDGMDLIDKIPQLTQHGVPIVLLAAELPTDNNEMVAAVLVKSEVSSTQVASAILSHLPALQT